MQYNNGQGFFASSRDEANEIWNMLGGAFGGDSQVPMNSYGEALEGRIANRYQTAFGPQQMAEMAKFVAAIKAEINHLFEAKWGDAADVPFE